MSYSIKKTHKTPKSRLYLINIYTGWGGVESKDLRITATAEIKQTDEELISLFLNEKNWKTTKDGLGQCKKIQEYDFLVYPAGKLKIGGRPSGSLNKKLSVKRLKAKIKADLIAEQETTEQETQRETEQETQTETEQETEQETQTETEQETERYELARIYENEAEI